MTAEHPRDGFTVHTKRWDDPSSPADGYRLLVTRYRPRAVRREDERWNAWLPQLGPSKALHAAAYGKGGVPKLAWPAYVARYLEEMRDQGFWLRGFAERVARGETLTLLCSSACIEPSRCHRTVLRELLLAMADELSRAPDHDISSTSAPRKERAL